MTLYGFSKAHSVQCAFFHFDERENCADECLHFAYKLADYAEYSVWGGGECKVCFSMPRTAALQRQRVALNMGGGW